MALSMTYQQWLERGLICAVSCIVSLAGGWFTVVRGAATGADLDKVEARLDAEMNVVASQVEKQRDFAAEQRVFNEKVLGRIEAKELIWSQRLTVIEQKQENMPALVVERLMRERAASSVRDAATGP